MRGIAESVGTLAPRGRDAPTMLCASESVRDMVARSWQRCRAAGLDPNAPRRPVKLDRRALAEVLEKNSQFIETALPSMTFLESAVRGSGFILVLTDRNNIVLRLFGDDAVMQKARENNYVPGCCRSEEEVGTNSIALASIEGVPLQLAGDDHYNVRHRRWTCSSAPVFSPQGQLLGTVTLSGDCKQAHRHTLGIVIAAAEAIQNRLRELSAAQENSRSQQLLNSLLRSVTDAIVTLDADGRVTHVSRRAEQLLACRESTVQGRPLAGLFEESRNLQAVLAGRRSAALEVVRTIGGRRVVFELKPFLHLNDNASQGCVLAVSTRRDCGETARTAAGLWARHRLDDIVGESPAIRRQVELARMVAARDSRVLITGETGTGKELFAQGIHNASRRAERPFVAVNCAAIPRELIESELIGFGEGAFTGARRGGQVGKFELADGGTLFLDEISQMPLDLQAKLLRILEEGLVTRLGETKPVPVDVRIIAATNEDLPAKCEAGAFRRDLYFRLGVAELAIPPLRDRRADLEALCAHVLRQLRARLELPAARIAPEALALLAGYSWPGNVRELENVLEMAAILAGDAAIGAVHLPERLRREAAALPLSPPEAGCAAPTAPMRDIEAAALRRALREFDGNIAMVARRLGLSRSTVYRKMRENGLSKQVTVRQADA